eukprot:scpid23344/ scgid7773/ 
MPEPCAVVCPHPGCWQAKREAERRATTHRNATKANVSGRGALSRAPHGGKQPAGGGEQSNKVRSRFALPRRSDMVKPPNAALMYVQRNRNVHAAAHAGHPGGVAQAQIKAKQEISASVPEPGGHHRTHLPRISFQQLGAENAPAEHHSAEHVADSNAHALAKTATRQPPGCPAPSLDCLLPSYTRYNDAAPRRKWPPRLSHMTVQCSDMQVADDTGRPTAAAALPGQYVWVKAERAPDPKPRTYHEGTGYYWEPDNPAIFDHPSTPSLAMSDLVARGPMVSSVHAIDMQLRPDTHGPLGPQPRHHPTRVPSVLGVSASMAVATSTSSVRHTTPSRADAPAQSQHLLKSTKPPSFVRRHASARRTRTKTIPPIPKQKPTKKGLVELGGASLSASSSTSVVFHNSRRVRAQSHPIRWGFYKLADPAAPVVDSGSHLSSNPAKQHGQRLKSAGRLPPKQVLPSIEMVPDLPAGKSHPTMPAYLESLLERAKLDERQDGAEPPAEVFGSDLYLMAPTAANSPTPAQFAEHWMKEADTTKANASSDLLPAGVGRNANSQQSSNTVIIRGPHNTHADMLSPTLSSTSLPSFDLPLRSSPLTPRHHGATPGWLRNPYAGPQNSTPLPDTPSHYSQESTETPLSDASLFAVDEEHFMDEYYRRQRIRRAARGQYPRGHHPRGQHPSLAMAGLDLASPLPFIAPASSPVSAPASRIAGRGMPGENAGHADYRPGVRPPIDQGMPPPIEETAEENLDQRHSHSNSSTSQTHSRHELDGGATDNERVDSRQNEGTAQRNQESPGTSAEQDTSMAEAVQDTSTPDTRQDLATAESNSDSFKAGIRQEHSEEILTQDGPALDSSPHVDQAAGPRFLEDDPSAPDR